MSTLAISLPQVDGLLKPEGEVSRQAVMQQVRTRSDRPAHIWHQTEEKIYGAWLDVDGWWRASAWRPDGRKGRLQGPLDLMLGDQ